MPWSAVAINLCLPHTHPCPKERALIRILGQVRFPRLITNSVGPLSLWERVRVRGKTTLNPTTKPLADPRQRLIQRQIQATGNPEQPGEAHLLALNGMANHRRIAAQRMTMQRS